MCSGAKPTSSSPSNRICPDTSSRSPMQAPRTVDFPAPIGPTSDDLPGGDVEVDLPYSLDGAVSTRQRRDLQQRGSMLRGRSAAVPQPTRQTPAADGVHSPYLASGT